MVEVPDTLLEVFAEPFPDEPADPANKIMAGILNAVLDARIEPEAGSVLFTSRTFAELDKLPPKDLSLAVEALHHNLLLKAQKSQLASRSEKIQQLGTILCELQDLYLLPEPRVPKRKQPNNPYQPQVDSGANLSYQQGAMRHRSGKHR